jgi:hypothetical protein
MPCRGPPYKASPRTFKPSQYTGSDLPLGHLQWPTESISQGTDKDRSYWNNPWSEWADHRFDHRHAPGDWLWLCLRNIDYWAPPKACSRKTSFSASPDAPRNFRPVHKRLQGVSWYRRNRLRGLDEVASSGVAEELAEAVANLGRGVIPVDWLGRERLRLPR